MPKQKQHMTNALLFCCSEASYTFGRGRHNSSSGVINPWASRTCISQQRDDYRCARRRCGRFARINGLQTRLIGVQLQISQFCAGVVHATASRCVACTDARRPVMPGLYQTR